MLKYLEMSYKIGKKSLLSIYGLKRIQKVVKMVGNLFFSENGVAWTFIV